MNWSKKARANIISRCYAGWGLSGKKVLDVGCGDALVSRMIEKELSLDLWGTDILDYRKKDIRFKKMSEETVLPFETGSFDCVMFNDILHHCRDIENLILEGSRIAPEILIFEDRESLLLKVIDVGLNFFYCRHMPCPLNFKTEGEWLGLFDKLGFNYNSGVLTYQSWYPLKHMAFRLFRK